MLVLAGVMDAQNGRSGLQNSTGKSIPVNTLISANKKLAIGQLID